MHQLLSWQFFLILLSLIAYKDPETKFQIFNLIFWSFVILVFTIQCFGVLWYGFLVWFGSSIYLMLKFEEVFEKIQLIKRNPKNALNGYRILKAIEEHNFVHKLTEDLNHFFRMITLIIYLTAAPGFIVCLILATHEHSSTFTSIYALIIFFTCFIPVVGMNLLSSSIDRAAKKSRPLLLSYLSLRNTYRYISAEKRLKILSFLDHLTGADIGFSCYTLFHMDMMAFFEFIYMCGANYFLLLGLFWFSNSLSWAVVTGLNCFLWIFFFSQIFGSEPPMAVLQWHRCLLFWQLKLIIIKKNNNWILNELTVL